MVIKSASSSKQQNEIQNSSYNSANRKCVTKSLTLRCFKEGNSETFNFQPGNLSLSFTFTINFRINSGRLRRIVSRVGSSFRHFSFRASVEKRKDKKRYFD
ncbi:hypothetical protein CEXT_20911 [Caerostris extrusa]|uniref:Uncharacterized protein n=1 Tax=Caerostris extrusa TaxID=172846 RepID=A0AAV4RF37_CAEEX|nr:hypothetical protein CEXT_20911 [Caerostris extrusa]